MIEANWLAFVLALLIGILVAYWLYARGASRTKRRERRPDALDEGAEPARRNQALIDAPPAAGLTSPPGAGTMAGIGEVVAVAARDEVDRMETDTRAPVPDSAPSADVSPPPSSAAGDDLGRIKGIGPKLAALLTQLGVTSYAQIATWTEEDLDRIDSQLGSFAGRPRRDNWVEQAKLLSSGDTAAYEAKFGRL